MVLALTLAVGGTGGCGKTRPPDILLIVLDTVGEGHLGVHGYARPTTPGLDGWAQRAAVFEHAVASSSWTLPSVGSIFTGQPLSRHGAGTLLAGNGIEADFAALDPSSPTLAEHLKSRGYHTVAVVNNTVLDPRTGMDRGFDVYDFFPATNEQLRRADVVVDLTLRYLERDDGRPWFVLAHFFDPHMDYDPHPSVRHRFAQEGPRDYPVSELEDLQQKAASVDQASRFFVRAAHDEEILYLDGQIDRLLRNLQESGALETTLVILVSDHGEELFEHEGFEHGHTLYEELLRVPLMFWGPGVQAHRVETPVSINDILPTVLEAVGGPSPPADVDGVSQWRAVTGRGPARSRALMAEGVIHGGEQKALLDWPLKLILHDATGTIELYDLSRDPGETTNLAGAQPETVRRLTDSLVARYQFASRSRMAQHSAELSPETRQKLKVLGYLD